MSKSLWIVLVMSVLAGSPALADQCNIQAAEFASQQYVKVSPRMPGNFFLLTDERFPRLSARLVCNGPLGMAVSSLSPPRLEENWIYFVVELGSVLTKTLELQLDRGIRDCISDREPELSDLIHYINYQAHHFNVECDLKTSEGQIEFSVTR
jgi:hypothetical protein